MIPTRSLPVLAVAALIATGCRFGLSSYSAPSGEVLRLQVVSAQTSGPDAAEIVLCFELPSDSDWVLGRILGDVALSDGLIHTASGHFELVEMKDTTPPERCDRFLFARPGGFQPGTYVLTVKRVAADTPPDPDWAELQNALDEAGTGIVIAPLPDADGMSFALVSRPPDMTDQEAALIVTGMAEPVVLGPWDIPVIITE